MAIYEKVVELCKRKKITEAYLERDLGFSQGAINKWKKSTPSARKIQQVADYFNVSMAYLMGFEDNQEDIYKTVNNIYPTDGIISFDEIGTIRAGFDFTIDEIPTGNRVDIPVSSLHNRKPEEYFVLAVKGSSMYPKLIEGDKILCLRCDSVDSGDLAVVLYNGDEATVKKVNYVYGQDWLELIPINPEYETKRIKGAELQQCRVLGKVVKLIRDF